MSSGIQALLKTEKDAAEIVNEARKYRTSRLKSAKSDAKTEIDEYKKQKEEELKAFEKEHESLNDTIEKDADLEVEKELSAIKSKFENKKASVINIIVEAASKPTPELHINAK